MAAFIVVWLGQIVSVLASGMSGFALTLWMFEQTESATAMGLMQVFYITPFLVMSIPAGVMVDRFNRKLMMMISDLGAVIGTFAILILYATGDLQFWHLYIVNILYGLGNTFQWPAYSAAISTMVPKEQLGRVNGMMSLMEAGPGVLAPILAGALYPFIGLTGLLIFDVITFFIAIGALLVVHIPQPAQTAEGAGSRGGMLKEAGFGFKYIFERPSLLGLQLTFFLANLFAGMGFTLLAPMILARSGQNSLIFGTVQTAGAIGAVVGGLIMSAWGGFKKRVHGVLAGWAMFGLAGWFLMGFGRGIVIWVAASVLGALVGPLINASNQAIWQSKVAPDVQGRVFSARRLIAWFASPITPLIAGPLADFVFEPAMRDPGSAMAQSLGFLTGTGPGTGMSLMLIFCGLGAALVGLAGYFIPAIREAETRLPDHEQMAASEAS